MSDREYLPPPGFFSPMPFAVCHIERAGAPRPHVPRATPHTGRHRRPHGGREIVAHERALQVNPRPLSLSLSLTRQRYVSRSPLRHETNSRLFGGGSRLGFLVFRRAWCVTAAVTAATVSLVPLPRPPRCEAAGLMGFLSLLESPKGTIMECWRLVCVCVCVLLLTLFTSQRTSS